MKRLVKGCAVEHGYLASFMKTSLKSPGSGLHSTGMQDSEGANLFALEDDSPQLRHLLADYRIPALALPFLRQTSTATSGLQEPCMPLNVEWGYDNRPQDSVCLTVLPKTVALKCALLVLTPILFGGFSDVGCGSSGDG